MTLHTDSHRDNKAFTALLRRETILLIVLAAVTVPLFLFTRSIAAWNRQINIATGRVWYERARKSDEERASETSLDYLRKATTADRDNMDYRLALAEALDAAGQSDEARQILLRLRDMRPEDGRINLDLARLSVKSDEIDAARRYYHQALYGMWPAQLDVVARTIRMELVRFLVSHHDTSSAASELLILDANSPGDAGARTELGNLFLEADEPVRALNQFLGALKLQPMDPAAMAGAGHAQFKLGNDAAARRLLQAAAQQGPLSSDAQHALDLASLVLSSDPLANGIGARERAKRLTLALGAAGNRLKACSTQGTISDPTAAEMLKNELAHTMQQVSRESAGTDLNLLRDGLKLASRAVLIATNACKSASDAEQVIVLSAERHKVNTP